MREDGRSGDVYSWSWPARPVGDDPYQWRGPVPTPQWAAEVQSAPVLAEVVQMAHEIAPAIEAKPEESVGSVDPGVDVWVELPAVAEKPVRSRGRRTRGKPSAVEAASAAPEEVAVLETSAPAAEPALEATLEPAPEPALEPALEPVAAGVVALASTAEPAEPDPNEIVAPPTTPRRGWWRRG